MSKDFKSENPAMAFISNISKKAQVAKDQRYPEVEQRRPPKGYKMDPKYVETKSKRVGILIQPSVLEQLKGLAFERHISVNEAINESIQQYIKTSKQEDNQ